jgi:hypothetical protein
MPRPDSTWVQLEARLTFLETVGKRPFSNVLVAQALLPKNVGH